MFKIKKKFIVRFLILVFLITKAFSGGPGANLTSSMNKFPELVEISLVIEQILNSPHNNILVIFDLNNTLIKLKNVSLDLFTKPDLCLVDSGVVSFIKELEDMKNKHIRFVILTKSSLNNCTSRAISFLNQNKINFSNYFDFDSIKDFKPQVFFGNGCIYLPNQDKGLVLYNFLKYQGYFPDEIYFFDDQKVNLRSVKDYFQKQKSPIMVNCFWYRKAFEKQKNKKGLGFE